ncbi:MAG: hypothetical protein IJ330_03815, partial [Oscillospiraceae bacterium]|nr:hypothetical protein [Oscillospiraceae bacterium]
YAIDDFENNSGIQQMGRVYKSAYIDGARKEWLVGGEAFYGDSSYFINIEGQDGDGNVHIDSAVGYDDNGDGTIDRTVYGLSYTITLSNPGNTTMYPILQILLLLTISKARQEKI